MPTNEQKYRCVICRKGVEHVGALYRANEKGQPGIWVCKKHRHMTDAPVHADVDELIAAIGDFNAD